ncbi:putative crossover junction endodeoxyribonuclease [Corynebacterium phage phi16]|uniref:hypothetical protein n=1 Tax=Corynebacterium glutamicum TaxID=1718 RepID=UPI0009449942|nr:hypothetical protein [Corynebacterium glutamicum]APQ42566.1 putative crossover junction endodeoxyribonuclease [Corynebacterium phage phi16]OKX80530.1 hypothetical protein AUO95_10315 [Corynebacterium glutamicum]
MEFVPLGGVPDRDPNFVVDIDLPWLDPPLSMNDRGASRGAVMAKSRDVQEVRAVIMFLLRRYKVPKGDFVSVQLHFLPRNNVRRDTDNLVATLKPICDAIAKGTEKHPGFGVVEDDAPVFMAKPEPIIYHHPRGAKPKMWLTLKVWMDDQAPQVVGL